ncbi:helix-turn-helix domain-containing protein [Nevskia soli]|uniref:helix-turn-helix domain-containing protein n=1 Tax=Nevskia soli TaxID=418856 RepID=UPI000A001024
MALKPPASRYVSQRQWHVAAGLLTTTFRRARPAMNSIQFDNEHLLRPDIRRCDRYPATLTSRQIAVLRCVREGLTNTEAAARLGVSLNTVKWHLKELSRALGTKNRCAAVHRAQLCGLI